MIICHISSVHGPYDTRIFYRECKSLSQAGYVVKLITLNEKESVSFIDGIEVINMKASFSSKLDRIRRGPKLILQSALAQKADVYHFHDPELLTIARKLSTEGAKVVYDAHEDVPKQILSKDWIPKPLRILLSFVFRIYENHQVKKLDGVITVVDSVVSRMSYHNSRVVLVRNFPLENELIEVEPSKAKVDSILYVGDLTMIRGIAQLVESMEFVNGQLLLAGKWSDSSLEEIVKSKKGYSKTQYLGFIDKQLKLKLFSEVKAGVLLFHPEPNHIDALPNKLFEYMAAGLPVVASNFGRIKEIVTTVGCGICVDPTQPRQIAEAISTILSNDEMRAQMGERGQKAVRERYNWKTEERKLIELYANLCSE